MKKFLILVIVLLILVLNLPAAQWQWLSSAKLLSRNDKPPTIYFGYPKISISNHSVYVVWSDFRNGRSDIYFNYSHDKGAKWQLFDIRLDSGDLAGRSSSYYPQISSSGNYVYVVWSDFRNGPSEIYINYSHDGGETWKNPDFLLNTSGSFGYSSAYSPQISSCCDHVYVVWEENYHGIWGDIYFNFSLDGGASWQASDIRLDTDDLSSKSISTHPQICSSGDNVFVVWEDSRNGKRDIYFNCSSDWGATWLDSDIRLDTGDLPGHSHSFCPQISSCENHVYAV